MPNLIREVLDLSVKEKLLLDNIQNAIIGYFDFISHNKNKVTLKDIYTKKEYVVTVIDLDYKFNKGYEIYNFCIDGFHFS